MAQNNGNRNNGNLSLNFLQSIGQLLKRPVFSGYGGRGGSGWLSGFPTNGTFDYKREAGPLWDSDIPLKCLKWEQRATVEAELCVQKRDANGDWQMVPSHPVLDVLYNPNDFFDMHQLLDAVRFDYHLAGNAYLQKVRSASGRVIGLCWIPSWMMEPRWEESGASFIDCYEYRVNGQVFALPVEDVIHFRNGLDPRSYGRKGLSDFHAVLREVCTDNEAAVYTAALLRNMGIPGVIISPKGTGTNPGQMTKTQRAEFREIWNESFTGERRGEPFIQSIPVDVTMPGFSPQQLSIDKIRQIPEQRIVGSFGLTLSVLQLSSGLENSNSRANKSDDREQCYESCVIPTTMTLARTLTRALLSEFDDIKTTRVWFDLSEVKCLQEDKQALYEVLVKAAGGPFLTSNEARVQAGLKALTGGDELRAPIAPADKSETDKSADSTNDKADNDR